MRSPRALDVEKCGPGVDAAEGAHALVTDEYLIAKIAGIGAQPPLVDAEFRAEREAPWWNFQIAPAAEGMSECFSSRRLEMRRKSAKPRHRVLSTDQTHGVEVTV